MKHFFIGIFLLIGFASSEYCHNESDWCYDQAINFAFYIFEEANINGVELARGQFETDGTVSCPNFDCDIVGAFSGDICVGWSTYYINEDLDNKFTLAVNGYDGNEYSQGYLVNGQVPTFKFYDTSSGIIIDAVSSEEIPMFQNFGGFVMGELNAEFEANSEISIPAGIFIQSIYPNPFNPITQLDYLLNYSDKISITIYDIAGNKIEYHPLGIQSSGNHSWIWDANSHPSGEYFIQLNSSISIQNQKVILLK